MYAKSLICFLIGICLHSAIYANNTKREEADSISLAYYYGEKWQELLAYGKNTIKNGTDFNLLRMRTGYAAFMLGNYSESLKQYAVAYTENKKDTRELALYYLYLNNVYLNNTAAARYYSSKMKKENRVIKQNKPLRIPSINFETSYKHPTASTRGDGMYYKIGFNTQLGYRMELQQAVAAFNQKISETKFAYVSDSNNINIQQKEYYAKLSVSLSARLNAVAGFHYIYTPFNNYTYNNKIGFAGLQYDLPYMHLNAMVHIGNIADSAYNQVDAGLTIFPLGNSNLYSISKAAYGKNFVFTQIAGVRLQKNIWLEANTTLGKYNTLLDNDDLYLFNDIDTKKFKIGTSLYIFVLKKMRLSLNYSFEKKQYYGTTSNYFYQHSTTGGLQWNF